MGAPGARAVHFPCETRTNPVISAPRPRRSAPCALRLVRHFVRRSWSVHRAPSKTPNARSRRLADPAEHHPMSSGERHRPYGADRRSCDAAAATGLPSCRPHRSGDRPDAAARSATRIRRRPVPRSMGTTVARGALDAIRACSNNAAPAVKIKTNAGTAAGSAVVGEVVTESVAVCGSRDNSVEATNRNCGYGNGYGQMVQ